MTQAITSIKESGVCSILLRLLLAVVFGGIIGTERGKHGRAAGMRTHILVCIGATMTTLIGEYVTFVLGMSSDPVRIGAQVISGIGFLGAGMIMTRGGLRVKGLTTAAGLWATATIGLALGIGLYSAASLDIFKDLEADGKQKLADAGMEFIDIDVDSFRACMDKFYELAGWTDDFKSAVTTAMETYRAN